MRTAIKMDERAQQLLRTRTPFVHATVVRAAPPTSAHPGDEAILLSDGTIEGFVGGHCAQNSVRKAAMGALQTNESVLLRVLPDGDVHFPEAPGACVVVNPCLSGGALEIFLVPQVPAPLVRVFGATPIADALVDLCGAMGYDARSGDRTDLAGTTAVVIASLGGPEAETIRAALDAGVGYIGLVASRVRGASILSGLELTDAERSRVHTPVGLAIGAKTPAEIAVSIVAEVIKSIRVDGLESGRMFTDVDEVIRRFDARDYLLDLGTASAIYLAVTLGRPLLLEGEPGVGKTTAAKTLAAVMDTPLLRLQCYEGLTAAEALYDWNYQRQLLSIRLAEAKGAGIDESDLYTEEYLVDRPILQCVRYRGSAPPVLLIDEIDRADDEFEALLLEFLGEAAVTVPELGTFVAERPPIAVLTSNRSRDLHDALRRRCLYHWIDYPEPARAAAIVRRTVPGAGTALIEHAAQFVSSTRGLDLDKPPGVAETIDWVAALVALGVADLVDADTERSLAGLGALAKTPDDYALISEAFAEYSSQ